MHQHEMARAMRFNCRIQHDRAISLPGCTITLTTAILLKTPGAGRELLVMAVDTLARAWPASVRGELVVGRPLHKFPHGNSGILSRAQGQLNNHSCSDIVSSSCVTAQLEHAMGFQ